MPYNNIPYKGAGNRRGAGSRRGAGGRGGLGRGSRASGGKSSFGPPEKIIQFATFIYPCEDSLVCKVDIDDVPYFNAPIFLHNGEQVGKLDEIFGTIRNFFVSIKLSDYMGANNFKKNQIFFIDPQKLMPISRFLPKLSQTKKPNCRKRVGRKDMGSRVSDGRQQDTRGFPSSIKRGYNRKAGVISFNRGCRGGYGRVGKQQYRR